MWKFASVLEALLPTFIKITFWYFYLSDASLWLVLQSFVQACLVRTADFQLLHVINGVAYRIASKQAFSEYLAMECHPAASAVSLIACLWLKHLLALACLSILIWNHQELETCLAQCLMGAAAVIFLCHSPLQWGLSWLLQISASLLLCQCPYTFVMQIACSASSPYPTCKPAPSLPACCRISTKLLHKAFISLKACLCADKTYLYSRGKAWMLGKTQMFISH